MDTTFRVTKPLRTLEELYDSLENLTPWPLEIIKLRESAEYVYAVNDMNNNGRMTTLSRLNRDEQPRTIICHDMKGGYLEDRFIDGSLAHDSYLFYYWSIVDVFIYFSHSLITIPPYGWINAAHNHGVKVLGTLITENINGEKVWEKVLSTIEETKKFADALVALAKFYEFEGWLLNVENKINPQHIEQLLYFIQYLTVRIHEEIQSSEIIWYDSVTVDGHLKWQNTLNDKNKCFFDNCDGIFLNYNWNNSELEKSRALAASNGRINDVHVGLDVWGRGCPGGGGFNSLEALEKIRQFNLSVAIFAPGWTHEYFGGEAFTEIESIFWAQLSPLLYIHVPIYDNERFVTSFCRGSGQCNYHNGVSNEENVSFYNLSLQQPQISVPPVHLKFINKNIAKDKTTKCLYETIFQIIEVKGNKINLEKKSLPTPVHYVDFCKDISYNGGGCLKLVANRRETYQRLYLIHLEFNTDIQIIIVHKRVKRESPLLPQSPTLILIGNNSSMHLEPYENVELITGWRQSFYHAVNIKTIYEFGLIYAKAGCYYVGKIELKPMPQNQLDP